MSVDNANRRFCSACGAPLTDAPFCGQCGTKVPVMTVEISASVTETAPVVEMIPDPQPVVQIEARPWRFPVASVILMGIVTAWMVIQLFINQYATWSGIAHVCCAAAVLVGMIVCRKKRNLIVGFAFLTYAGIYLISTSINYADQLRGGIDFSILITLLLVMIYPLSHIAFSISYLVAKPKIAILKNIIGGFLAGFGLLGTIVMGVALITSSNISNSMTAFLSSLLYMLPMGLSVIFYTPFRRR